ncbi:outer membrane protein assembly factor BamB family protein [Gilvimarinus sp. F26214L]|uniref:outer membrane protein assembly factor BamB family protein n=1 Tax=Gilvimarinus sp. DZF01 TaxID=3461371 RepID=UPI0040453C54
MKKICVNPVGLFGLAASLFLMAGTGSAAEHPGQAVYEKACATCHDNPEQSRSPAFETLKQMSAGMVTAALTSGKMKAQGDMLSLQEKSDLVGYLTAAVQSDEWIDTMMCANKGAIDLSDPKVRGFGFDLHNSRHLTAEQAGLSRDDFADMELAWSFAFPGVTGMRSQPAVVGSTLFLPVAENAKVYAIDIASEPCIQWVYQSDGILRSGAAYGEQANGRKIIAVNDYGAAVHVLDANTGELLWKKQLGQFELALGTGTPAIHEGVIYVPVSQNEIMHGAIESYVCCQTHGMVVALDASSGKIIWEAHAMEDAKPVRDRGDGQMLWGPSGAPIWNSPAIDEKRGVLYVGTGEATSAPAHENTDAILAIDLKDGSIRWSFQATANDIYLIGCHRGGLNCEKDTVFRDVDFGASIILAKRPDGSEVILGGQKSGTLWALDPDDSGKVLWRQQFGTGAANGGIHWGIAYDGERVYAPINRAYAKPTPGGKEKPGIHAVDVVSGERIWTYAARANCEGERAKRVRMCETRIGHSGAPTAIDGAVVSGTLDGMLRVFDSRTGEMLFEYNVARDFESINGIKGRGGSIDNATIVANNGLLLVSAGYALFNETPGNVLLAFKPKNQPAD